MSQCIQIPKLSLIIAPPLLPRNCFGAQAHLVPVTQTRALHFTLHPAAKRNTKKKLQVTNACAHQGGFPFLFLFLNVQIHSGHAESCSRRSSSSVCKQNVRVHGRTYVRARGTNAHTRTTHTHVRAHTDGYTDGLFMPDLITVWLLADTVGAVSLSAQPVEPLMQQLLLQSSWRHEEEEEAMIDC